MVMNVHQKKNLQQLLFVLVGLVLVNLLAYFYFERFDLTADQRYTLSKTSIAVAEKIDSPVYIDVYLDGEFPAEFKRLETETRQLLEEYHAHNSKIIFLFTNPLADASKSDQFVAELNNLGMAPTNINSTKNGKKSVIPVFPWAIARQGDKAVKIPLLVNNFGNSADENIDKSVQMLEFSITDALTKITLKDKKKIAILKGNGEISEKYMGDFLMNLKEYYRLGEFNLDSLKTDEAKTLENLKRFDLAIIAKPTEAFSDSEKYILDQYIMGGGKTMWLIDKVSIDLDSLHNEQQTAMAYPRDLQLDDLFFSYGVRINYGLVQDLLSTPITAQTPNGDIPIDWLYSPIIKSRDNHPINKNLNLVKLEFANPMDTLKNGIRKTVLLQSSAQSKAIGAPVTIGLNQFMEGIDEAEYDGKGNQIVGLLLEGAFTSAFKDRVKPVKSFKATDTGVKNKMIVISDGDIVNYLYVNKKPLNNTIDQWTQQVYSNKEFLLNSVNYLLDDSGLISIRSKDISLPLLNEKKVAAEYTYTQLLTVGLPLVILALFGVLFTFLRKRRFGR